MHVILLLNVIGSSLGKKSRRFGRMPFVRKLVQNHERTSLKTSNSFILTYLIEFDLGNECSIVV